MTDTFSSVNAASGVKPEPSPRDKKKEETLGQDQFLHLFVTQLQNQDPMNPQDSTEMTAQMAQYSQLEQLTNMNKSMKSLLDSYQSSDKLSSLNTIGKEAAYIGSDIAYEGEPVSIGYRLKEPATEVSIVIKRGGAVVATITNENKGAGDHYLTWDGTNGQGEKMPKGEYTFSVQAVNAEGKATPLTTLVRSEVTGVDLAGKDGGTIMTKSGAIPFNTILGVFNKTEAKKEDDKEQSTTTTAAAGSNPQEEGAEDSTTESSATTG